MNHLTEHMVELTQRRMAAAETKSRLSTCWEQDIQWDLFPKKVKEVIKLN